MDMNETSKIILSGEYSRRRGYLTNVITTINILAITGTLSIWGFFIKWDFLYGENQNRELFAIQLALASGLSSILLGLWRLYARYLDNGIIQLYPTMYLCECKIVPDESRIIKPPKGVSSLKKDYDLKNIDWKYVGNKDFGHRGHRFIDGMAVIFIFAFSAISLFSAYNLGIISFELGGRLHLVGWLLIGNIAGLLLVLGGWWRWNSKKVKWPVLKQT